MNVKLKYIIPKVKNRIQSYIAKLSEHLPVEKISLCGIDHVCGKADLMDRLERMLGGAIPDTIRNAKVEDVELILGRANESKQRIFNVLGSGPVKMASINWSREIKTGFEWPVGTYYLKQRVLTPKGSDIKVPWEISRCHHLLWMAEAYCLIGDESYAEEVVGQIRHWVKNNPLMYSVNWSCAMDVSIRAVNWMYALVMIGASEAFTDGFAEKVYKSLYQHLFFIKNNLEKCIPYSNNHYVSDLVGLLYLGSFFSTTSRGRKALKFAKREYIKETLIEVLPSGINYEKSVSYHRLMAELLVYSRCMLKRIGEKIPKEVDERLRGMLEYIRCYSVNNSSPLICDNDNGRLLPFVPRDFKNHTYLIDSNSLEWNIIKNGIEPLSISTESPKSQVFTDANVAVLKRGKGYVFVSCSPRWKFDKATDKFTGTHLHNDLLSFVYCYAGKEIIIDAGAFCYTSDMEKRNEFRSTMKHNTIMVDDEEQNFLDKKSAFGMKYNSCAEPLVLLENADCVSCKGEYETIAGKLLHQRTYNLYEERLEIIDTLKKFGKSHSMYMSFHFANDIDVHLADKSMSLKVCNMRYKIQMESQNPLALSLKEDTISPSFGVLKSSKTLVVQAQFDERLSIKTIITNDNECKELD